MVVATHVILASIYIFRDSFPSRVGNWATSYCSPLFHQNWMLFAPNVSEYDVQLQYCLDREDRNHWMDISRNASGSSPIERAERYFANSLTWDYVSLVFPKDGSLNFDAFVKSRSYQNTCRWTCNYLRCSGIQMSDSLRMRLHYKFYDAENSPGISRSDSVLLPACSCDKFSNVIEIKTETE